MKRFEVAGALILCVFLAATVVSARRAEPREKPKQEQQNEKKGPEKHAKHKPGPGKQANRQKPGKPDAPEAAAPATPASQRPRPAQDSPGHQKREQRGQRPQNHPQPRPQASRLPPEVQQQRVAQQQQRLTQYRQHLDGQQQAVQRQTARLEQQHRAAQYRFQNDYAAHLRQQQLFLESDRHPDYDRDPYFSTPPIYRYSRGGHSYEINKYGADSLRQAVNAGYEQGFHAGDADRQDHWRYSYRDGFAYQDANYGYNGYYVERDDYNYYFREGFRRGYEDGYYNRSQYGHHGNGVFGLLDTVLSHVLAFTPIR